MSQISIARHLPPLQARRPHASVPAAADPVTHKPNALAARYGVDPEAVPIRFDTRALTLAQRDDVAAHKTELILKLLETHEHAVKNQIGGNLSGRQYSTMMQLRLPNGKYVEELGTNWEHSPDSLLCGERNAFSVAWNKALESTPVSKMAPQDQKRIQVERLLMSSSKPPAEDDGARRPCCECLSMMASQRYFSRDTEIISLFKDPRDHGRLSLRVQTVGDFLPMEPMKGPSVSAHAAAGLPVMEMTRGARAVVARLGLKDADLEKLMGAAQTEYGKGAINQGLSGNSVAAAVLASSGSARQTFTSRMVDFAARWELGADVLSASQAIQSMPQPVSVDAVAYYGDVPEPTINGLGWLAQSRGGPDTLVATIQNDRIEVRTILDYLPFVHSSKQSFSAAAS